MRIICQLSESTNNLFPTHTTTFKENSLQAHPGSLTRSPHDHHLIRRLLSTRNHLYHRSSLPFYLFSLSSVMKIIKGLALRCTSCYLHHFGRAPFDSSPTPSTAIERPRVSVATVDEASVVTRQTMDLSADKYF